MVLGLLVWETRDRAPGGRMVWREVRKEVQGATVQGQRHLDLRLLGKALYEGCPDGHRNFNTDVLILVHILQIGSRINYVVHRLIYTMSNDHLMPRKVRFGYVRNVPDAHHRNDTSSCRLIKGIFPNLEMKIFYYKFVRERRFYWLNGSPPAEIFAGSRPYPFSADHLWVHGGPC